jgi:Zn ribbon nucleic-acid-binding protein
MTPDDRPPICPACGVTMGLVVDEESGETSAVCLECGFEDEAGSLNRRAHSHSSSSE